MINEEDGILLEKAITEMQELPSQTSVKSWLIAYKEKFYHIAAYTMSGRLGDNTGIWLSDKKGRRKSPAALHTLRGKKDPIKCATEFFSM